MLYPPDQSLAIVKNGTEYYSFTVTVDDAAVRIDKFVADKLPSHSRSFMADQIKKGNVAVNGVVIIKTNIKVKLHDTVEITIPQKPPLDLAILKAATNGLQIIYEHEHFLIINKPAGLLVHTPHKQSTQPTLTDWLINKDGQVQGVGQEDRPGIVHRLDKDTSGIMLVARTAYGHLQLGQLFRDRQITKEYWAVVNGHPAKEGAVDTPIGRDPVRKVRMATFAHDKNGLDRIKTRHALTHFKVISYFQDYSLIQAHPVTGRTHQIRVHMTSIGHPIIGDVVYGCASKLIARQALHARRIAFIFDGQVIDHCAPLADDMQQMI
jgi:23S rRNA pseudouridine1911/1915/1917 synthase